MATYPCSGKCYLTPTSARAGGTIVPGIVDNIQDSFTIQFDAPVDYCRTGLGAKGGIESRMGHEGPLILLLPLRDNGATSRSITLAHLTTNGTGFQPTGSGATNAHGSPPSFAMIVRPTVEAELHLYSPCWRLATNADLKAIYGQGADVAMFGQNIVPLIANRAPGQTTRAWLWGTYAAINTEYGWSEGGEA